MHREPARSPDRRRNADSENRLRELKHRMKISFAGLSDGIDSLVDLVSATPPKAKITGRTARRGTISQRE